MVLRRHYLLELCLDAARPKGVYPMSHCIALESIGKFINLAILYSMRYKDNPRLYPLNRVNFKLITIPHTMPEKL